MTPAELDQQVAQHAWCDNRTERWTAPRCCVECGRSIMRKHGAQKYCCWQCAKLTQYRRVAERKAARRNGGGL